MYLIDNIHSGRSHHRPQPATAAVPNRVHKLDTYVSAVRTRVHLPPLPDPDQTLDPILAPAEVPALDFDQARMAAHYPVVEVDMTKRQDCYLGVSRQRVSSCRELSRLCGLLVERKLVDRSGGHRRDIAVAAAEIAAAAEGDLAIDLLEIGTSFCL